MDNFSRILSWDFRRELPAELALGLGTVPADDLTELFALTDRLRRARSGNAIHLCAIINAKSGRCSEDCRFCAQSGHWRTAAPAYPLLSADQIVASATGACDRGARAFGIVTSGKGIERREEVDEIERAIAGVASLGIRACVSPGVVAGDTMARWKAAGLWRYHHNLETARSFFPSVCTTHDYEEDVAAVRRAQALGLTVCCGGLFGLGESWEQRVELGVTLRELRPDSVPVNFLIPVPGTPLADAPVLAPRECLRTIALLRLLLPRAAIRVCGGREHNLRAAAPLIFAAGADSIMVGDLLTTTGPAVAADLAMLADLGLEPAP